MLAKRTSKNQVTLPKAVVDAAGQTDYYEVAEENGRIVLTPVRLQNANAVRDKLAALRISQADIDEAVAWARKNS